MTNRFLNVNGKGQGKNLYLQWVSRIASATAILLVAFSFSITSGGTVQSASAARNVQFWVQTMDSCRQAIPGAAFRLTGNSLNVLKGPAPGRKLKTVSYGGRCPVERGNCQQVPTGCLSWNIPVPASGSKTYQITETSHPANYASCLYSDTCNAGPVTATLVIDATGKISARVHDVDKKGRSVIFPTAGVFIGSSADPIVIHNTSLTKGWQPGHDNNHSSPGSPGSNSVPGGNSNHSSYSGPGGKSTPGGYSGSDNIPSPTLPQTGSDPGDSPLPDL